MAFTPQQIQGLNAAYLRRQQGSANQTDITNLNYAMGKGWAYQPTQQPQGWAAPAGYQKVPNVASLGNFSNTVKEPGSVNIWGLPNQMKADELTSNKDVNLINPEDMSQAGNPSGLISSSMTGANTLQAILDQMNQPSQYEGERNTLKSRFDELTTQLGGRGDRYGQLQKQYQTPERMNQLSELNKQIVAKTAMFDQAAIDTQGKAVMTSMIGGRQSQIARQKAAEVGALSAASQALQGDINLANQTIQDTLNAEFGGVQDEINVLKTQLDINYQDMNTEEKKRADQFNIVLAERQRQLDEEKENKAEIYKMMLTAAQNGADNTILQLIAGSKNLGEAIINSGQFVRESKVGNWGTFTDGSGNTYLLNENTGETKNVSTISASLGDPVGEISGLPSYDTLSANPGVNRSDRNNNPGNIKVSDYTKGFAGVIGVESNPAQDGGYFLVFDSPQSGINAIGKLLSEGKSYKGVTAETAIKRYNGNGSYGAKDVGLDPNKDFQSQISDVNIRNSVANKIAQLEGFTGGASPVNQVAENYAKLIQQGKMKIENIKDDKTRNDVANILANAQSPVDIAAAEEAKLKLENINALKNHKGLANAVGTIRLGRLAPFQWGQKDSFIGNVEQIVSELSLDKLIESKAQGATFGALSNEELRMLASSATKIGTWRRMDSKGNVTGYKVSESEFKKELDNIANLYRKAINTEITSEATDRLNILESMPSSTNPLGI